jgi:imidazolonepropionase-like amidohydrolase
MWSDWWGGKMEMYDGIRENTPFVHNAGACAIVHSDSATGIQRLHQEASKSRSDAAKVGLDISKAVAWKWLSYNPAKAIGIDKMGDVVIWTGDPFSVYSKAEVVFIDGAVRFDLNDQSTHTVSDFRLGHPGEGDEK